MTSDGGEVARRMADQVNSLEHFQRHSRLHFIGQWKTKMHDEFQQEWFTEHPEWNHGRILNQTLFVHVDMDAFFCNVQLAKKEYEHLRELPVGIAAGRFNSDISSCNYVARSFGIHAGMYVNAARELCPDLVILGYDLPACERVTKALYRFLFEAFTSATPPVRMSMEVYSIDEVMIATDSTDYEGLERICELVRRELQEATGCTASCGIGPNIMLARLATQKAKPNGIRVIRREEVPQVMQKLPFREIHGAGRTTRHKIARFLREHQFLSREGEPSTPAGALQQGGRDAPVKGGQGEVAADEDASGEEVSGADSSDSDAGGDEANHPVVLCSHVQKIKREDLQALLGKKAGDTFYHLCRGDDFRVIRRTGDPDDQKAMGKTMPASVGCSMNYAVRPRSIEDVWSIVTQLLNEVCGKMKRLDATAQALRLTLLERHPCHPKETQKFMGRGRCVEVHVPVKFVHALDGAASALMLDAVKDTIRPLLVTERSMSDRERAEQLGLDPAALETQIIWTVTLTSLENILIEDLRGMTIQATGLRPRTTETDGANNRKRERPDTGQMTLAAAFSRATRRADSPVEEVLDSPTHRNGAQHTPSAVEEATEVTLVDDEDQVVEVSLDVGATQTDEVSGVVHARDTGQTSFHPTRGHPQGVSLFELSRRTWCTEYQELWYAGCREACNRQDVALVKAYLRCALFSLSSALEAAESAHNGGAGEAGSGTPPSQAHAEEMTPTLAAQRFTRMIAFVQSELGGWTVDFA